MTDICTQQESIINIVLGIFLIFGTIITYIPQYIKIVKEKTSRGVSVLMQLLLNINSYQLLLNAIILQFDLFECCKVVSVEQCQWLVLPHYLLFFNWFMNYPLFLIVLMYYPVEDAKGEKERKRGWLMFLFFTIYMIVAAGIPAVIAYYYGINILGLEYYAYANSISSSILVVILYIPQIYETYKLKSPGSLSVIMLVLQTPGLYLFFLFLVIDKTNVTTWFPPMISSIQMTILLIMCIYYIVKIIRRNRMEEAQGILINEEERKTRPTFSWL